jgi:hypothetical protein
MGRRDTTTVALGEQYLEQLEMKTTWFRYGSAHTKDYAPREFCRHLIKDSATHSSIVCPPCDVKRLVVTKRRADVIYCCMLKPARHQTLRFRGERALWFRRALKLRKCVSKFEHN